MSKKRSLTFPQSIRPIFIVCQIFAPIPLQYVSAKEIGGISKHYQYVPHLRSNIQRPPIVKTSLLLCLVIVICVLYNMSKFLLLLRLMMTLMQSGMSTYAMSIFPGIIAMIAIHCNSLLRRDALIKIIDYFYEFDEDLTLSNIKDSNSHDHSADVEEVDALLKYKAYRRRTLCMIILHGVLVMWLLGVNFFGKTSGLEGIQFAILMTKYDGREMDFVPFVHLFMAFMNIIKLRLDILRVLLEKAQRLDAKQRLRQIKLIRTLYLTLHGGVAIVRGFFDVIVVCLFAYIFMLMITRLQITLYVIILVFNGALPFGAMTAVMVISTFSPVVSIWLICSTCQQVLNNVKHLCIEVNSQLAREFSKSTSTKTPVEYELEEFQAQIQSCPMKISALGLFNIDNELMYSVMSAIMCFTLIFFPFTFAEIQEYTKEVEYYKNSVRAHGLDLDTFN